MEHPIHETQWQENEGDQEVTLRLTCTRDGQIKMTDLSDSSYEQQFSNPDEASSAFTKLIQQGQQRAK